MIRSLTRLEARNRLRMLPALLAIAAGQAKGNGLNAFGGLWHEVTTSGSAPAGSSSSGSGGGRYGY